MSFLEHEMERTVWLDKNGVRESNLTCNLSYNLDNWPLLAILSENGGKISNISMVNI